MHEGDGARARMSQAGPSDRGAPRATPQRGASDGRAEDAEDHLSELLEEWLAEARMRYTLGGE